MASLRPHRALIFAIAIAWMATAAPPPAFAQEQRIPRDEYFRLLELDDEFTALDDFLAIRLAEQRPDWPEDRRKQTARFFAFIMTASGLTAGSADALEAGGIDIIHAITADARPFSEQSLLADLVIVGDIIETEIAQEESDLYGTDDGYHASTLVDVRWTLKGQASADTVVIRQREARQNSRRDIRPEEGRSYLLLLSNGMYRYGAANHAARNEGWLPTVEQAPFYSIYRIYPMEAGRIAWGDFTQSDTDFAFEDIRRVDHILSTYRE